MEHGDAATAWALYEELIGQGLCPHEETWDTLFKRRSTYEPDNQEQLLQILLYMRDNQIYPHYHLASTIKTWFERWSRLETASLYIICCKVAPSKLHNERKKSESSYICLTHHCSPSFLSYPSLSLVSQGNHGQEVGPEPP